MNWKLATLSVLLLSSEVSWGITSVNAVWDGDFEDNTYIKMENLGVTGCRPWQFKSNYTPEQQAEIGRANDLGYWIGSSAGSGGSGGYGGLAISTYDDPRAAYASDPANINIRQGVLGNQNVSKDPSSSNHYLDSIGFRKGVGQIFTAPANTALGGQAKIQLDYVFHDWSLTEDDPIRLYAHLFGLPTLPEFVDLALWDGGGDLGMIDGEVWLGQSTDWFNWGDGEDPNVQRTMDPTATWNSFSRTFAYDIPPVVGDQFQYFYLRVDMITYSEENYRFLAGIPNNELSLAMDNVDVRLPLLADANRDGTVNALDISGFVSSVTSGIYKGECDTNRDRAVNALDISKFIYFVTGGSGDAQIIPEPASMGLLLLGGLALLRRR